MNGILMNEFIELFYSLTEFMVEIGIICFLDERDHVHADRCQIEYDENLHSEQVVVVFPLFVRYNPY